MKKNHGRMQPTRGIIASMTQTNLSPKNLMKRTNSPDFWLLLLTAVALTGCSIFKAPLTETRTLEGAQRDAVLAYAAPKADNVIEGLIAGDYEIFSADFSDTLKQGMDQTAFADLLGMFSVRLGSLQSYDISVVLQDANFTTVAHKMIFDKDDAVVMRVVFANKEPHPIDGLWFDSPELRKP